MSTNQIIRIHKNSLDAVAAHYVDTSMDDSNYIQIVRVLITAAITLASKDGETDAAIALIESSLRKHAREFYISNCAESDPEVSNKAEYIKECGVMFDYIYTNNAYPDE
ncbi:MAG: hypothetical protein K9K38_13590 [Rhodoferax sp.]|nr:hypothetical protein [Rhodoferax sp.]